MSKQAREKYAGLSEEEKDKEREYRRNKCHTMSEKEKMKGMNTKEIDITA